MSGFWKPASSADLQDSRNADDSASFPFGPNRSLPLAQQRLLLPIAKHKRQISYAVENHGVVVIVGQTGSGKSTQLPQFLLEAGWAANDFSIVCTQPRRLAAITLAQRVSQEQGSRIGERVGYCVRFDEMTSPKTQIKYVTDGILLREATVHDPLLSSYSVVIVDEAHERTLQSDAILGLLKKIRKKRPELRIVVCSATIDAQAFLDYFIGKHPEREERKTRWGPKADEAPSQESAFLSKGTIISVDGRQYPVDVLYLAQAASDYVRATVETALEIHRTEGHHGDILCFLPSAERIDQAIREAEEAFYSVRQTVELLPLYGTLPYQMQARIFDTSPSSGARRIIFATNIAETSVTVPNISHVIDSGLVKLPYFEAKTGFERLIVGPISQASAKQRAGRAGRVQAGKCYRLYTEKYLADEMAKQTPPEILRTNLTSFILTLKALGVDNILAFDLMDVPSLDAIVHGLESLYALGAMDDFTHLTKQGMDMSVFPTEPRVSRMLLESLAEGCSWEVLGVASALQVRDLYHPPRGSARQRIQQEQSQQQIDYDSAMAEVADLSGDHVTYVNILAAMDDFQYTERDCRERFLNYVALKRALEVRQQLAKFLRKYGRVQAMNVVGDDDSRSRAIRRCVTAGFFFNVAKLANDGRYHTLRNDIIVTPCSSSILTTHTTIPSEYIVFGETQDGPRGGIELKSVSSIEAKWLRELAPHYWV